jgi:hypothetical protein
MAVSYVTASPGTVYISTTPITTTKSVSSWWVDTPFDITWEELYQQKTQSKTIKYSVQESPRKKDIRFLNRPA